MGDYTKLIVNATVRCTKEEVDLEIDRLRPGSSSYHTDAEVISVEEIPHANNMIRLCLICQTKYGARQEDFLSWLAPLVVRGSGPLDTWAFQIDEHSESPTIYKKRLADEKDN